MITSDRPALLIVGNSVSLSPGPGILSYPERLAAQVPEWRQIAVIESGATVEELASAAVEAIRTANPRAVVLQVGINECAPRPLGPRQRRWVGRVRPLRLRGVIVAALHRWRPQIIRLRPLAQNLPPDRFDTALGRFISVARSVGAAVLLLPIPEVHPVAERRTPFTNREIRRYTALLDRHVGDEVSRVDVATLFESIDPAVYCIRPDSVHWSAFAHERAARYIAEWLSSLRLTISSPA